MKRVAIIGAGASGLTSLKCCLDEDLEPVCFERSDDIGGLWNFQEQATDDQASIYKSLIINTSKEMMCYSDFPIPASYPNYMHNSRILDYFRLYAKRFDLMKYTRLKTSVCSVTQRQDFASSGQWDVTTRDSDGQMQTWLFDAVMVCTGHHTNPHLPLESFPGIDSFKGQYIHSKEYKDPRNFEGKRVVVIGIGNSGGDLAVEISRFAQQVRTNAQGIVDCSENRQRYAGGRREGTITAEPSTIFSQHPMVNDDLPNRIISGTVMAKPNVRRFTETAAVFEDGSVEDVDHVVFATGYTFAYPFLDGSILSVNRNQVSLFPPRLERPTLAVVGLIQPLGAIMPISELQARWATRVFKGVERLPSMSDMLSDIKDKKDTMADRYVSSQRHTIQVDYVSYMVELAHQIGVNPDLRGLVLRDPRLAYQVFFGPCTPCQFRLGGPGSWPGARETILTQWDRALAPTKTRTVVGGHPEGRLPLLLKLLALFLVVAALCFLL